MGSFLLQRLGVAGTACAAVATVLACIVAGLLINRAITLDRLDDTEHQVETLQAGLTAQNAAVIAFQEKASRDQAERTTRALRVLAPRQKPNPKTVQELNQWLTSPSP